MSGERTHDEAKADIRRMVENAKSRVTTLDVADRNVYLMDSLVDKPLSRFVEILQEWDLTANRRGKIASWDYSRDIGGRLYPIILPMPDFPDADALRVTLDLAWRHIYEMREICDAHQRLYGIPYGPVKPATYVESSRNEWWRVVDDAEHTSFPTFDAAYQRYQILCDVNRTGVVTLAHVEVISRRGGEQ